MTRNAAALTKLIVTAALCAGGTAAVVHLLPRPPVFVDMAVAWRDSIPGRALAREYQRGASARQQHADEVRAAAEKLPAGSKERAAKDAEAAQVRAQVGQQDVEASAKADEAFRARVVEVLGRLRPGALAIPVRPLTGGDDLTDEVVLKLNAANEDAEGRLRSVEAENKRLRDQLAARPPAGPRDGGGK